MTARETGGLPPSETTDGIDTQTDAIRTDGGTEKVPVHLVAYAHDADLDVDYSDPAGPVITNHDEVEKDDVVRLLNRDSVKEAGLEKDIIEPGDPLWSDEIAEMEPGDEIRLDDVEVRTDGGTESLDLDIPDTVNGVKLAEAKLRDHFKATEVQLDTHDPDGAVSVRLQFRGFSYLEGLLDKVSSAAQRLDALPEAENIHCGVNTDGAYDPQIDEQDERPVGWVNADIDPDRSPDMEVP